MNPTVYEIDVEGMTCSHCQRAVEQCIAGLPGTQSVQVDLRAGRAVVVGELNELSLLHAIENEGYAARVTKKTDASE